VTDRDICMAAYTQGRPLGSILVANAMAREVLSCHADDSLGVAERLMSEAQIRRVPVVNGDNRAVGLVSLNDIARHASSSQKKNGLDREVTRTLAAICQPRPQAHEASPPRRRTQPRAAT
jgi:CBS domain-containing protein